MSLGGKNDMRVNSKHQLEEVAQHVSEYCDERPEWAQPELVVVHCVSLPDGEFGTGAAQRLFTGCLDIGEHPSFADLEGVHVARNSAASFDFDDDPKRYPTNCSVSKQLKDAPNPFW